MKKIAFIACLWMFAGVLYTYKANAQVRANININIGSQPIWGPVGYDDAQYYYFPDIDAYYNIPQRQFIYLDGGRWVFGAALPGRYHYDLYRGYKVVVNDPRPYLHPDIYRERYGRYKGWYGKQTIIRDSRDERYYEIKDHPMHYKWKGDNGNHNGWRNGRGNDRGDDHGNGRGHGRGHDRD